MAPCRAPARILVAVLVAAASASPRPRPPPQLHNLLLPRNDETLDFKEETAAKLRRLDGDWLEQWRQQVPTYAAPAPLAPLGLCNATPSQWTPLQGQSADPPGIGQTAPPGLRPRPQTPFRPSQPLAVLPVPPCFALIQFPPGRSFQLQFAPSASSPDLLPAWIVSAGDASHLSTSDPRTCLWTLRAPPGWKMKLAITHAQWGPARNCSGGSVRVLSQDAAGDLTPVVSVCAPDVGSASGDVDSGAAVLSARLSPSATFTLSVDMTGGNLTALPPDTLQPPPPLWGPYPWSSSNVDVESIHLTVTNGSQHSGPPSAVEGGALQEPPVTPSSTTTTTGSTDTGTSEGAPDTMTQAVSDSTQELAGISTDNPQGDEDKSLLSAPSGPSVVTSLGGKTDNEI